MDYNHSTNCANDGYDAGIQQLRGTAITGIGRYVNQFSVQQNVPNPAAGRTRIAYSLPEHVRQAELVVVATMSGKVMHTRQLAAGAGHADLDLSGLPNGVYQYRVIADGQPSAARQLVLFK